MKEKDDFIQDHLEMDISAEIKIELSMSMPVTIEGAAAFRMNDDLTNHTQAFILHFQRTSQIQEIPREHFIGKQEKR